uniref:Kanadaptin n=1 Tax=Nicotiana tabacum TaxID=4097 RepID=A0A1S3Y3P4_TOBAC|nr:PREDICTED: kanadaptin-like [Nicotiana tabacum]
METPGSNLDVVSCSSSTQTSMKPPPPKFLSNSDPNSSQEKSKSDTPVIPQSSTEPSGSGDESSSSSVSSQSSSKDIKQEQRSCAAAVPYTIPTWSGRPCHQFYLEVLKDGSIIDQFDVHKKGAYMFGRVDLCDFVLEHPTISRFHAVLQFRGSGNAYLYDLGSTHGTFINKNQVEKRNYVELHVGDVLRFGNSSRLYIFQGPTDLMPPEADLKRIKQAKIREEVQDMEASLLRAKLEASRADGISWGMGEDAIEENEDEVDEITWQTYKGQLTEKQEKTREKVVKRLEKVAVYLSSLCYCFLHVLVNFYISYCRSRE